MSIDPASFYHDLSYAHVANRFVEVWIDMSVSMQCMYGGMVVVYFFCSTGEKFCMYEVVI